MSSFRLGQRVKKVRGYPQNIGVTAVVTGMGAPLADAYMVVRLDVAAMGDICVYDAGDEARTLQCDWEPLQPEGHQPCDESFNLDLDRLLEREGVAA